MIQRSLRSATKIRPIILYELNEVPWQIIDWYIAKKPKSSIAHIIKEAKNYTTFCADEGELHPWVTWPTLHRGVNNKLHRIEFLNQDLEDAKSYPPIWQTLSENGLKVGVFGSLQSYPVPKSHPYQFYIPDTFAPAADTYPSCYSPLQDLNLQQTAADGGVVSRVKFNRNTIGSVLKLLRLGLSMQTVYRIARQLVLERVDSAYKTRRAILQAPIAFDVFKYALKTTRTDFCTFFTNHTAGMMHRYWKYVFPEEFNYVVDPKKDKVRARNIECAMDITDQQIAYLKNYADATGSIVLIASSMGQEAVHRAGGDQARVVDVEKFVRMVGHEGHYINHLAMHPDFNFEFETADDAQAFSKKLSECRFPDGRQVAYKTNTMGSTLNFGLAQPSGNRVQDWIVRTTPDGTDQLTSFENAGVLRVARDIGTGYHQPRGILIWYEKGAKPDLSRSEIDSRQVRPMLLSAFGRSETLDASADEAEHGLRPSGLDNYHHEASEDRSLSLEWER